MKFLRLCREFMNEIRKDNIGAHAASAAFFIFVSLIPMLILICAILPYTPVQEADLMTVATDLLPTSMDAFAVSLIEEIYGKSPAVISITAVLTVWASSKGILAMMRGLNSVNEVGETRNYFYLRVKASFDTVLFLIMVVISLVLMVFGNVLVRTISASIPKIAGLMNFLSLFRFLITWCVLSLLFVAMYVWLPNKHPKTRSQLLGAFFTSTGWMIFSFGFSLYIDYFGGYSMYGSLSTIIVILLWLYFCMYIMLLGAELNSMFDDELEHFPLFRKIREGKREIKEKAQKIREELHEKKK